MVFGNSLSSARASLRGEGKRLVFTHFWFLVIMEMYSPLPTSKLVLEGSVEGRPVMNCVVVGSGARCATGRWGGGRLGLTSRLSVRLSGGALRRLSPPHDRLAALLASARLRVFFSQPHSLAGGVQRVRAQRRRSRKRREGRKKE